MAKPIDKIIHLRKCDEKSARSFCMSVQDFFQGVVPTYAVIAQHLAKIPTGSPEQVAALIAKTKRFPLKMSTVPKRRPIVKAKRTRGPGAPYFDDPDREPTYVGWQSAPKNPLRSQNRLEPSNAKTCPHGIPFYRKCGICDKDEFHEMTGL